MDELRFDGQAVVVTGAGRGMGREYALLFAERGAKVVVNDLGSSMLGDGSESSPADEVVDTIVARGGIAVANYESIATSEGSKAVVDAAIENFGRIDALVNNAGIMRMVPFPEATAESLMKHFEVHVLGTFLMCKAAWPYMADAGYGRIVNTVTGGLFGLSGLTEYGPAKGAIFAFTRSVALEAAAHGIGVNAIAPQGATRMLGASKLSPELRERLAVLMRPALVAPGAVFLAHEKCLLNGETLAVSGGKVCRIGLTENEGIFDENLTPEMILDRIGEVLDESTALHWTSATAKYEGRAKT
jgi:NAD(P)-dependent dehydrogenase (short-subunit alcohol dehydrogenase family)